MLRRIVLVLATSCGLLLDDHAPVASAELSTLAVRLLGDARAMLLDPGGRPAAIFEHPASEARVLLLPVTRWRGVPTEYRPPDLTYELGRPVRSLIVADYRAMAAAAAAEGVDLAIVSGYRSPAEQAAAFEAAVWRRLARAQGPTDREEAEAAAARFVAPPGHSQHQLGTAVDLSTWEIGYAIQPRFAETVAGRWIARHAWNYGFVLPYPPHGEGRTGYGFEPWHVRWVGRPLAAALQADNYIDQPSLVVDDYLAATEEIMDAVGVP